MEPNDKINTATETATNVRTGGIGGGGGSPQERPEPETRKEREDEIRQNNENMREKDATPMPSHPTENPPDGVLADPRANDPSRTPETKEDAAAFPAEHEARLAEEIGATGDAERSRLEAEHARSFQREQQEIANRQTTTVNETPAPASEK